MPPRTPLKKAKESFAVPSSVAVSSKRGREPIRAEPGPRPASVVGTHRTPSASPYHKRSASVIPVTSSSAWSSGPPRTSLSEAEALDVELLQMRVLNRKFEEAKKKQLSAAMDQLYDLIGAVRAARLASCMNESSELVREAVLTVGEQDPDALCEEALDKQLIDLSAVFPEFCANMNSCLHRLTVSGFDLESPGELQRALDEACAKLAPATEPPLASLTKELLDNLSSVRPLQETVAHDLSALTADMEALHRQTNDELYVLLRESVMRESQQPFQFH
jgi:hypothetical protein